MASKPSDVPTWDSNQTNVVEPTSVHKTDGFQAPAGVPEKPTFQEFNYWMNEVYRWVDYLQELNLEMSKLERATFAWVSGTQITITGGRYYHEGTYNQVLAISSPITHTFTGLSGLQIQYVYIDDSSLTDDMGSITSSNIINSTTAPTFSTSKNGWYDGDDRCIFGLYSASSTIEEFYHEGDIVMMGEKESVSSLTSQPSNTWEDVSFTSRLPTFVSYAIVTAEISYVDANTKLSWRPNGSSVASGHYIGEVTSTADDVVTQFVVYLVGLVFEWRFGTSTTNAADLTWDGFYLPKGM